MEVHKSSKVLPLMLLLLLSLFLTLNTKNTPKVIKNTNDRHYQGFSKNELNLRTVKSLKYIRSYFQEYLIWLKNIKKFKLIDG